MIDPPGDGWQLIDSAPRKASVLVDVWNGQGVIEEAHYACDRSGEEQPAFGPSWFRGVYDGNGNLLHYREVAPNPTHWKPRPAV